MVSVISKVVCFHSAARDFCPKVRETQKLQLLKNIPRDFDETCGKPSRGPNKHLCQKCLKSDRWFPSP